MHQPLTDTRNILATFTLCYHTSPGWSPGYVQIAAHCAKISDQHFRHRQDAQVYCQSPGPQVFEVHKRGTR